MELFAQIDTTSDAFRSGQVLGIMFAMTVCGLIPLLQGIRRNRPGLGVFGMFVAGAAATIAGCLGGLPIAFLFSIAIYAVGKPTTDEARLREEVERFRARDWKSY